MEFGHRTLLATMALLAESFTAPALAAVGVLLLTLYLRSFLSWRARTKGVPLPPGPKPLPFVGNMFNMPTFKHLNLTNNQATITKTKLKLTIQ